MKARSRLLAVTGLGLFLAGCPNDNPYVARDDGGVVEPDAMADAAPDAGTFTTFVIDLITNHSSDPAPVSYEAFKNLFDPDGVSNNTNAYNVLFQ